MYASVALAGVTSVLRRTTAAKALYLAWQPQLYVAPRRRQPLVPLYFLAT